MDLKGINVIEFSGESCANCFTLLPILNSIMKDRKDAKLLHIEINEDNMDVANEFAIDRVPTILVLKDGKEISRCRGYQPEEILEIWLDSKIKEAQGGK